jgi:hypothetical protein
MEEIQYRQRKVGGLTVEEMILVLLDAVANCEEYTADSILLVFDLPRYSDFQIFHPISNSSNVRGSVEQSR